jgi:nucleoside-diphosphate-sugar epimerase
MKKRRVLVTGASGFLGSHIVSLLLHKGYAVSTLGRNPGRHSNVVHHRVDLSNTVPIEAVQDVDALVHLACDVHIGRSMEDAASYIEKDLSLTQNLLRACIATKKKPLVIYLSTDRVYGRATGLVTELSPTYPIEPYTASKLLGEIVLATYANLHDIPYIALRASAFFGPYQSRRGFIADMLHKIITSDEIVVGPLNGVKNFTYVENMTFAIERALKAPVSARNRIYNIGGSPISLRDVLTLAQDIVAKKIGKHVQVRIDRTLTRPKKNDVGTFKLSTLAARKNLRWKELVSLRKGLEYTIDHLLNEKKNVE